MLARPATFRDPGTPDQIEMEQNNLTHFPSQPWCKMCVESRGHDSPHREQSKVDAVVPQLQLDYGYMEDGGPLQMACFLVGTDTFWSHPRNDGAGLQEDGHALRCHNNSQVGAWPGVWTLLSTWRQRRSSIIATRQSGKRMSPWRTRLADSATSVTDTEPSEQWSSGESRLHSTCTCWNISGSYQRQNPVFCSDNNASVDDQTRSMDSHDIQCEKGHTNNSVREDSWTEIQKRDSSIGEQILARRPGANVNQLVQPWLTGLWLGRDTLSAEHLIGTAAGVLWSRAVVFKNQQDGCRSIECHALHTVVPTSESSRLPSSTETNVRGTK